jgi:ABC-type amino acid transport substrate-binding protein
MSRRMNWAAAPKGFALKITRLMDLQKAIDKALRKARELGLVAEDGE